MTRQRIHLRTSPIAALVGLLTLLLALALVWYGAMVILLAVKVAPHTVDALSAYRWLYDRASGVTAADFSTAVRLIVGFGGLLGFLFCVWLAFGSVPRPRLSRGPIVLAEGRRGTTVARPRALERVVECAARANEYVVDPTCRLGHERLHLSVQIRRAAEAANVLGDVQRRAAAALDRHQLPDLPVDITATGYAPTTRRDLS